MRLAQKTALITGASSGIGRAIALRFGQEGANVVVNYLPNQGKNEAAAREVVEAIGPDRALAFGADVTVREQVQAMSDAAVERFGRLDIAVNNAGVEIKKPFLEVTDEEWDFVLSVNLRGPFLVTQIAARQFLKQDPLPGHESRGKIVNISSTHEDVPFPGHTSYCAAKGGLRMLCRDLAVTFAPMRININNIAPGAIATPIQTWLNDPETVAKVVEEIPYGRLGKPEEIAGLAVYLASEESNYASGGTFYIDGGLSGQVTKY
jgi:Dehydrogenases with different specificities (related to short-chain alcohol dehydrogenases)